VACLLLAGQSSVEADEPEDVRLGGDLLVESSSDPATDSSSYNDNNNNNTEVA
jgi:hypothetical protein